MGTLSSKKRKIGQVELLQAIKVESSNQQPTKRSKIQKHPPPKHAKNKFKVEQHLLSKSSKRPSDN